MQNYEKSSDGTKKMPTIFIAGTEYPEIFVFLSL